MNKFQPKAILLKQYTSYQRKRYAHELVWLKETPFAKGDVLTVKRSLFAGNFKPQSKFVRLTDFECCSEMEKTGNVSLCKHRLSKVQGEWGSYFAFSILLVSSSAVWSSVGLAAIASDPFGDREVASSLQLASKISSSFERINDKECFVTARSPYTRSLLRHQSESSTPSSISLTSKQNFLPQCVGLLTDSQWQLSPYGRLSEAGAPLTAPVIPKALKIHSHIPQTDTANLLAKQIISPRGDRSSDDRLSPAAISSTYSFSAADLSSPSLQIPIINQQLDIDKQLNVIPTLEELEALSDFSSIDGFSLAQEPEGKPAQEIKPTPTPSPSPTSTPAPTQQQSQPSATEDDPDLGRLRLRERKVPPRQPQPIIHVVPRISYFYTSNVFSGVDPISDSQFIPSVTIWSAPMLRKGTYLTTSIDGYLIRYLNESQYDYNFVRFRTGINKRIGSNTFGEVGWSNQQYFRASNGDRFLNEHSAYLSLSRRDWLTRRLALDSYYDVRFSFADPDSRSRIINYLSLSFSYYLQRNLQVGLDYQFSFLDYTKTLREDYYQRLLGRVTYQVSSDSQISVRGGLTTGNSSESYIDYDDFFFSVTYSVDWQIFK